MSVAGLTFKISAKEKYELNDNMSLKYFFGFY